MQDRELTTIDEMETLARMNSIAEKIRNMA
jgi:hypothetical protein